MALTASTMLPLVTAAPEFALPDTDGQLVALADFRDATAHPEIKWKPGNAPDSV